MLPFSARGFKEQLAQPLGKAEIQFLIRTFHYACMFFLGFGILTFLVGTILIQFANQKLGWPITVGCSLLGFIHYFPLSYCVMKYRNDPMAASTGFVTKAFSLLAATFFFLFMGVVGVLGNIAAGSDLGISWFGKIVAFVFGVTLIIYAIPIAIAFQIQKKSTILNLTKFLRFCGFSYMVLFVLLLLVSFISGAVSMAVSGFLFILVTIMLFVSPIITLYQMRNVVPYINHNDEIERKRWESFFAFEISFQLLQLAWHIARIVSAIVSGRSSSRLQ